MTTEQIEAALADRYKGRGWANFFQFRPMTSFEATYNAIDLLAVGLWRKHDKIIAHEIKISRSDFLKDLKQFKSKHGIALKISHEFYYVCPWGLIPKDEIPEVAGLMYADKNCMLKIIKPAILRELDAIPFHFFQGFAREFGNKVSQTKIPIKYLGKDITQDDFVTMLEAKRDWDFERKVETKAKEMIQEKEEKEGGRDLFITEVKKMYSFYDKKEKDCFAKILKYIELGMEIENSYGFTHTLKQTHEEINKLRSLIDEKKWAKK